VVCPKGIGVWQSFGRGKTKGRRCKNNISKKKGWKSKQKSFFWFLKKIESPKKRRGLALNCASPELRVYLGARCPYINGPYETSFTNLFWPLWAQNMVRGPRNKRVALFLSQFCGQHLITGIFLQQQSGRVRECEWMCLHTYTVYMYKEYLSTLIYILIYNPISACPQLHS